MISEDNVDDIGLDHDQDAITLVVMEEWKFLTDKWEELFHGHKELWKNELYKKTMMMMMMMV